MYLAKKILLSMLSILGGIMLIHSGIFAIMVFPNVAQKIIYLQKLFLSSDGTSSTSPTIIADGGEGVVHTERVFLYQGTAGTGNETIVITPGALQNQTVLGEDIVDGTLTMSHLSGEILQHGDDCLFDNQEIADGEHVLAYQSTQAVTGSNQCIYELRYCRDGILGGSYQFSSCQADEFIQCTPTIVNTHCE